MSDMATLFADKDAKTYRDTEDVPQYKAAFLKDLQLQPSDTIPAADALIRDFLVDLCMNVPWYNAELAKKMNRRHWYVAFNIFLIIAVPTSVYLLFLVSQPDTRFNSTSSQVAVVVAQLTALLTGLFGINRVFLKWQEATSRYAQLWEAAANLKTEYFSLLTKWRGKVSSASAPINEEFQSDLKIATANARAIVRKEQDDFYGTLSKAGTVDALEILKEVQSLLVQAVPGLTPGTATKQLEAVENEQKNAYKVLVDKRNAVNSLEAELEAIEDRINKYETERNRIPAPSAAEQADLEQHLSALRKMHAEKESGLVAAKGALAALIGK